MNCNNDKKILKNAIEKIEHDQQFKPNCCCVIGPTGPTGPTGPAGGPIGPTGAQLDQLEVLQILQLVYV